MSCHTTHVNSNSVQMAAPLRCCNGGAATSAQVDLQGVSLVTLSFFRNRAAAAILADTVAQYSGVLGAAVCCSDAGGLPHDDWTTCETDRLELLDYVFELAAARGLLLDFHVDENGNEESRGLRDIARKTIQHGYEGRVVCGHCWCAAQYLHNAPLPLPPSPFSTHAGAHQRSLLSLLQ
jgi:hypothetical protein